MPTPYRTQLCALHARGERDEEQAWGVRPAYGSLACPACRAELEAHDEALAHRPEPRHVSGPESAQVRMSSPLAQRLMDDWMRARDEQVEQERLIALSMDRARVERAANERKDRKRRARRLRRYWSDGGRAFA